MTVLSPEAVEASMQLKHVPSRVNGEELNLRPLSEPGNGSSLHDFSMSQQWQSSFQSQSVVQSRVLVPYAS